MATYAVGDIQGCLDPLYTLLDAAGFDPRQDSLWISGDLVNRGPQSLAALHFAKSLPNCKMVLGNHDLHLLAVAHGAKVSNRKDTLSDILDAGDRYELLDWLQSQALVHHDNALDITMVHAGIPPSWSIKEALARANEVERVLRSENAGAFFAQMYGNAPEIWHDDLVGADRLRIITNYFTRMRFCDSEGRLELATKTGPGTAPKGFEPWFAHKRHKCGDACIIFGHWASLEGKSGRKNIIALDTGCVWGGSLSMVRLEDMVRFSVPCRAQENAG